jgi:hypothetical protein
MFIIPAVWKVLQSKANLDKNERPLSEKIIKAKKYWVWLLW